jgi:putative aldouronate transport system substrate-binding protein
MFPFLMNSFEYYDGSYLKLVDGTIQSAADTDGYKEGLRYLNKLYSEGLIVSNAFSLDRTQATALGMNDPSLVGAAPGMWIGSFMSGSLKEQKDSVFYDYNTAIAPLTGPTGLKQTPSPLYDFVPNCFSITKNCENPEVAMRWIDQVYSFEIGTTLHRGPEVKTDEEMAKSGASWRKSLPGELGSDGNAAIYKYGKDEGNIAFNERVLPIYQALNVHTGQVTLDPNPKLWNESLLWHVTNEKMFPYEADYRIPALYVSDAATAEFAEYQTIAKNTIAQAAAQFVTGALDIDKDWDKYVKDLRAIGLDKYIEIYQREYDLNVK